MTQMVNECNKGRQKDMEDKDYVLVLMQDVFKAVNENPLPISVKYFVLKDIFNQTEAAYQEYIKQQLNKVKISDEEKSSVTVSVPVETSSEKETKEEA